MARRKWLGLGVVTAVTVLTGGVLTVTALAGNPSNEAVQYSVPYVCGWLPPVPPDLDQHLKPGDYATAINIHNYTGSNLVGGKRVSLSRRMGSPAVNTVPFKNFGIRSLTALEIDCLDIWGMIGVPPGSFVKGAIHIGLPIELPVAAIYTSQTHNDPNVGPDAGAGHSIDVEQFFPIAGGVAG